ncbi:MAG: hypothetical protein IT365_26705 [Candidatus Hydrogenedentes bacterium]|nr:hypothetical protein [Candidatus Hydrogenedentota bacterium]
MIIFVLSAILSATQLPAGPTPEPVPLPHFPDRVHAFVWRNWELVPAPDMARVLGAREEDVLDLGKAMGLGDPPAITENQRRRSYITVIRRNWHLLPYEQMLDLLGWTEEELAFTLREDDFLYIKLGSLKPKCEPLKYSPPSESAAKGGQAIAQILGETFPQGMGAVSDPLFGFVEKLSQAPAQAVEPATSGFDPRYCYSYFALYGDPLLDPESDPYPDGYLARMAAAGANGVWLQAVLYKLAPYPWDAALSARYEERLANLRTLVERARKHGMGVYLYLNEPRAMQQAFFESRPELKGVSEGDYAAMCTSVPEVREYITNSIASINKAVPGLAGFFTITASENLTNCWSHHNGAQCPRCGKRTPAEVIAEMNGAIQAGIDAAGTSTRLIAWDWGWQDDWAVDTINALPTSVSLMSVSEWSIPIKRGGVDGVVGEYSISTIGPGPRATKHWAAARARGMKAIAKIQAGNTWELSAVPYIPAVENVAKHAANLRGAGVDGLMLGWTLGGYPSPNLEVVSEIGRADQNAISTDQALLTVAQRRYGEAIAPAVVAAWRTCSAAFSEFPYNGGTVYSAPLQVGPTNLLWESPTGYRASMVGIPYDDLNAWRSIYPPEVFCGQLLKIADGFDSALKTLRDAAGDAPSPALREEMQVMEASSIHFRSVANQVQFVMARDRLAAQPTGDSAKQALDAIERILKEEIDLARRMYAIQRVDSRIGFEASNHYFYVPVDSLEKVINCRDLLDRWLPTQRAKAG